MSALSNKQKTYLAQLARRAFNLEGAKARGRGVKPNGVGETLQDQLSILAVVGSESCFRTWRHEQVGLAAGKDGLRLCDQMDYKKVEAHFLHLLGDDGRALNAHLKAETEPRRQAEDKLIKTCNRLGYRLSYAAAICSVKYKVSLDDATAKQLWDLVFTVEKNARKKATKGACAPATVSEPA